MASDKIAQMATGSSSDVVLQNKSGPRVATLRFAGRLGGNQEFIASPDDQSLLKKQPDAAPLSSLSASLDPRGFADSSLWRMAFLELWGTMLLIFLLGAASIGLTVLDATPFSITLYAGLVNWFGLSIFTYTLGPVSGGHLNPTITMSTFFAGLSTFPRAVLYISGQSIGAIIAGFFLKLGAGGASYFTAGVIPGCTVDASVVSPGQMFAYEFMFGLAGIFMAFGVGLDPRQAKIYGPAYGPVLVGITLGLTTICSSIIRPGYTGASFNPARCLGLMTAKFELQYHWVHWVAPFTASVLNGVFYHVAPPWRKEDPLLNQIGDYVVDLVQSRKHRARDHHNHHNHHEA